MAGPTKAQLRNRIRQLKEELEHQTREGLMIQRELAQAERQLEALTHGKPKT